MPDNQELLSLAIETAVRAGDVTLKYYQQKIDILVKQDHSPLTLADLESNRVINEFLATTDMPILSEENKQISYTVRKDWKVFWLVDPLDGTKEFINKRSEYTVNIALVESGIPKLGIVCAPALNIIYYGMPEYGSYKSEYCKGDSAQEILDKGKRLRPKLSNEALRVVASRSHISDETKAFIEKIGNRAKIGEMQSYGSSLKLCMVAEGSADIYPRLGPTMEWDTAASHAIAISAGCIILNLDEPGDLCYNKQNLLNPWFIVYKKELQELIESIL